MDEQTHKDIVASLKTQHCRDLDELTATWKERYQTIENECIRLKDELESTRKTISHLSEAVFNLVKKG